jgi:hypothetical protein
VPGLREITQWRVPEGRLSQAQLEKLRGWIQSSEVFSIVYGTHPVYHCVVTALKCRAIFTAPLRDAERPNSSPQAGGEGISHILSTVSFVRRVHLPGPTVSPISQKSRNPQTVERAISRYYSVLCSSSMQTRSLQFPIMETVVFHRGVSSDAIRLFILWKTFLEKKCLTVLATLGKLRIGRCYLRDLELR